MLWTRRTYLYKYYGISDEPIDADFKWHCNRLYECVHVYKELEMQSVHFWPNAVNA